MACDEDQSARDLVAGDQLFELGLNIAQCARLESNLVGRDAGQIGGGDLSRQDK